MEPFRRLAAVAIPFDHDNVDTDQIIPARFLKYPRADGYGRFLFHDQRFTENGEPYPDFIFNRPAFAAAKIIVAGANFGSGSSREGAVYALADYGIRAVIAPSFGQIFHNNCFKNGVLPVRLPAADIRELMAMLTEAPGSSLTVDLEHNVVIQPDGRSMPFTVDPFWREALLKGVDEIGLTMTYAAQIAAFERDYFRDFDWVK